MNKYLKVMFGNKGVNFEYKIGEVNIADNWNPSAEKGRDFGGFNYASEDCILRWLHRGDILYDVEVPIDAENIKIEGATTLYRCNKIILTNPRKVTDEMALKLYKKSNIPEKSYYKALGAVSLMNYKNTALAILRDKVNSSNINVVLDEWNDFMQNGGDYNRIDSNETVEMINEYLNEIKSDLLISLNVSKNPYVKILTDDKIINLTGQSGAGKSYYARQNFNNEEYEIIDTDEIFSKQRFSETVGLNKELGQYFRNKYEVLPTLENDFDLIYEEIINYCKNINKTIVIDCAQFHMVRDLNKLKGKIIIIRTDIDTCYNRTINRWISNNENYTEEELKKYSDRKKGLYSWYKGTNEFIKKIDSLEV